jgi:hypothetical protein
MKKQMMTLVGVLSLLFVAGSAFAQTVHVRSNVPFNFIVEKATLPAGEYDVRTLFDGGDKILVLHGPNSHANAMLASNAVESRDASEKTMLVFDRIGDRYFLRQVWVEGEKAGRELPKTKLESEIAANRTTDQVVVLAMLK